jgi:hypothetical protein
MVDPELPYVVFGTLALASLVGWLIRPLIISFGRRLEGQAAGPALQAEVDELRFKLQEMNAVQQRLGEVEERLEFTERLLAKQQEPERLAGGGRA